MKFQALTQPNCIGFLSQHKDFTNCISIFLLWPPSPTPLSQNHVLFRNSCIRYPSKPLLWTLGSAESHLSTFLKASLNLHLSCPQEVGSDCGWLEDELTRLAAQLTACLAELSLAEINLSPSNIIFQLFLFWEVLSISSSNASNFVWKADFAASDPDVILELIRHQFFPFFAYNIERQTVTPIDKGLLTGFAHPCPTLLKQGYVLLSKRPQ